MCKPDLARDPQGITQCDGNAIGIASSKPPCIKCQCHVATSLHSLRYTLYDQEARAHYGVRRAFSSRTGQRCACRVPSKAGLKCLFAPQVPYVESRIGVTEMGMLEMCSRVRCDEAEWSSADKQRAKNCGMRIRVLAKLECRASPWKSEDQSRQRSLAGNGCAWLMLTAPSLGRRHGAPIEKCDARRTSQRSSRRAE